MIFPLIICCRKTRCLSFFFQLLCLNILFLDPYESELISLFINWIHKASAQEVCVPVDFFFPSSLLLVFFERGSLSGRFHFDFSLLLFLLLSLIYLRFPEGSWSRIHCCVVRIYPNWKPSGKQVALFLHIIMGQKWNPRTETNVSKCRYKLSPSYYSCLQK